MDPLYHTVHMASYVYSNTSSDGIHFGDLYFHIYCIWVLRIRCDKLAFDCELAQLIHIKQGDIMFANIQQLGIL